MRKIEFIKKLGWFFGPYKFNKKEYYTHLMCAIWSPDVYLHKSTNKFKNLEREIMRSRKNKCSYCHQLGAGLGCVEKSCKMSYHFKCAIDENLDTRLDHKKYELYCPLHVGIFDEKVALEVEKIHCEKCGIDSNEDLILLCDRCDRPCHTYCLDQ